ncbi:GNAT family N-acetyltransferase [Pseudoalteromonas piscicida]|uniref:GNAT family N-acetyltransferase n=1 Tax=Pseudoalteromonas piscicida TaxID=43662 RepID=UPI0030A78E44
MYLIERLPAIMTPLVNKFYDKHRARGRAAKHDHIWVAKYQHEIVAACRLQPVNGDWLLVGVYVVAQHRKQGIANRLIKTAIDQLYAAAPQSAVYTFAYDYLIDFYSSLGFSCESLELPNELAGRLASYLGQNRQLVAMYHV